MIEKIFIVDDDPLWVFILQKTLESIGYKNTIAYHNGADCIKNISNNPDLVFLDYQMEEMDGLEVLKKIKDQYPSTGVIFCTGHQDLNIAVDAMKYGSCDYLLKENATKKEVRTIIEKMLSTQVSASKIF